MVWPVLARYGRCGVARRGKVRAGKVWQARRGSAGTGSDRFGKAGVVRRGVSEYGGVRQARHGL